MEEEKPIYVLSYGGGVNSSALFFYLIEKQMPLDVVIFADTQEESPQTYDAVKRMQNICQEKSVKFVTVTAGSLYDYYFVRKKVMSFMKRDCTWKFKISPIRRYLRSEYGKKKKYVLYIGIAWDEYMRMRKSDVKYIENRYPFCDDKITRLGNFEILKKAGFQASKSGCKGCIFTKKSDWIKMRKENPNEFERHLRLEENNSRYPSFLLNGHYPLRSIWEQQSLDDYAEVEKTCRSVVGGCFL